MATESAQSIQNTCTAINSISNIDVMGTVDTRYGHSYNEILIVTYTHPTLECHFK